MIVLLAAKCTDDMFLWVVLLTCLGSLFMVSRVKLIMLVLSLVGNLCSRYFRKCSWSFVEIVFKFEMFLVHLLLILSMSAFVSSTHLCMIVSFVSFLGPCNNFTKFCISVSNSCRFDVNFVRRIFKISFSVFKRCNSVSCSFVYSARERRW